ncbi:MAG TPA: phage holin family protein [Burkholderiaceae bacterium]|nr:phage holin family protein [Burkholderiaceae bacterium]
MAEPTTPPLPPLAHTLKGMGGRLLALLQVRLELFSVEAREEINRATELLALVAVACVLGCLGLGFLAILITVALWDSHRLVALTAFTVLFLTLAGVAVWQAKNRMQRGSHLFEASLGELKRDRETLKP